MSYVATNELGRKEFESITEAQEFAKQSKYSRIYTADNFGNMTKLSEAQISELIAAESPKKPEAKPSEGVFSGNEVSSSPEDKKSDEESKEPDESSGFFKNKIVRYSLIAIMAASIILAVVFLIMPLIRNLNSV